MDKPALLLLNPQMHLCSLSQDGGEEWDTTKGWTLESEAWIWVLSLKYTSCVTLDKYFFSLNLKFLSANGKRIPLRVTGKNKSFTITYVKSPCNVPGTWWIFKHSREKRCLGRKNLPVFLQTYSSDHFYSGMTWAVWPRGQSSYLPEPQVPLRRDSRITPRGRDS